MHSQHFWSSVGLSHLTTQAGLLHKQSCDVNPQAWLVAIWQGRRMSASWRMDGGLGSRLSWSGAQIAVGQGTWAPELEEPTWAWLTQWVYLELSLQNSVLGWLLLDSSAGPEFLHIPSLRRGEFPLAASHLLFAETKGRVGFSGSCLSWSLPTTEMTRFSAVPNCLYCFPLLKAKFRKQFQVAQMVWNYYM